MRNEINLLDQKTINQIAAGEVIESPSDIIKELIENSLDANSKTIKIYLKCGGIESIKIIDDGYGIEKNQIKKAFLRYSTNKINNIDDLNNINTMGFRGEALSSISSISKVTLSTKIKEDTKGYIYCIQGGKENFFKACAMNNGTNILIENLFFNTPVRKKFLGSVIKETRLAINIVEKLALSRPDVIFIIENNNKVLFKTKGNNDIKDVVSIILSKDISKNLIYFEGKLNEIFIKGFLGSKEYYRGDKNYQYFFINNRIVKNNKISQALERAYKNILPINKHPICIINFEINQKILDINVHPRKNEVKIINQKIIDIFLENLIKKILYKFSLEKQEKYDLKFQDYSFKNIKEFKNNEKIKKEIENKIEQIKIKEFEEKKEKNPFKKIEIIKIFKNTYIMGILLNNFYLFDQHAVHERIRFEKIKKKFNKEGYKSQFLLKPFILKLGFSDYYKIIEHIMHLKKHGIILEIFGKQNFIVRGIPFFLKKESEIKSIILSLIDKIENNNVDKIEDFLIEKYSCLGSIKSNDILSLNEAKKLIIELGKCKYPFTCPHGRPTIIKWNFNDLEKMFLRR